jgi:hypothetical protein
MAFDLSAVDAELEQLGRAPDDPLDLARSFAGAVGSLAQVDHALSALAKVGDAGEPLYVTRPQRTPMRSAIPAPPPSPLRERMESEPEPAPPESSEAARSVLPGAILPASIPPSRGWGTLPPESNEPAERREDGQPDSAWADSLHPDSVAPAELSQDEDFSERQPPRSGTVPSLSPASERPAEAAALTQSQEIVLPDPIPHEELSTESGELSLDARAPGSGSFNLSTSPSTSPQSSSRIYAAAQDFSNLVDDEVQDALDGSRPLSMGAPASAQPAPVSMDRDPDAEFDALLSEATDPRGIPTGSLHGEVDTDDLLRGLEIDELEEEELPSAQESEADQATHEADALARSLFENSEFEDSEGDQTEILDRAAALAIEAQAPEGDSGREEILLSDEELDPDELEIMMDDEPARPPVPASSKMPPPPPSAAAPEKRPSFLGRLFGGKREGE